MDERETRHGSNRRNIPQFVLQGHLHSRWLEWFDGFTIIRDEHGQAILVALVIDQVALHGVLKKSEIRGYR